MTLTVAKIDQAVKAGVDKEISDGAHGLALIVKAEGSASFTVKYKWAGAGTKIGIGPVNLNDIKASLDRARVRACEIRTQADAGIDPKKAIAGSGLNRTSPRWIEVAREVMAAECADMRSKKAVDNWVRNIEVRAKPLHDMQCHTIDLPDVAAVIEPYWTKYPKPAREFRGRLAKVFNKIIANKWGMHGTVGDTNPASEALILATLGKQPVRIKKGFKSMPYEDVPALVVQLQAMDRTDADTLLLKILTCGRSGETINLEWTEINDRRRSIEIPGRKMKNGLDADIPLSAAAWAIIEKRRALRKPGEQYVFPGKMRPRQHDDVMRDLLNGMQVRGRPHGFRASYRSYMMNETDFDHTTCEFVLHHIESQEGRSVSDVAAAYMLGSMWRKRLVVLEAWAAYVTGTTAPAAVAPVSHLQLVA